MCFKVLKMTFKHILRQNKEVIFLKFIKRLDVFLMHSMSNKKKNKDISQEKISQVHLNYLLNKKGTCICHTEQWPTPKLLD